MLHQRLPERGAAGLIGLLLVLLVIMVILLSGPLEMNTQTRVTQAQTEIDRAAEMACAENRHSLRTNLTAVQLNNPGVSVPIASTVLRKQGQWPVCSRGGEYVIGADGAIYCTHHLPPPAPPARPT